MLEVSVIVRIEKVDRRGGRKLVWERCVCEEGNLPGHLAQNELFTVAHAQLHPPRKPETHLHD